MTGIALRPRATAGFIAGIVVSNGMTAAERLLPSASFGILPALLAGIAGIAFSLSGIRIPGSAVRNRIMAAASLPALPAVLYAACLISDNFAFISEEYAVFPFLSLICIHILLVGLPIAMTGLWRRTAMEADGGPAAFLIALGAGLGLTQFISPLLDARWLFLAQSAAAALLWLPATEAKAAETPGNLNIKEKRKQRRVPAAKLPPAGIPALISALAALTGAAWFQYAAQQFAEWTMTPRGIFGYLAPATAFALGAGIIFGRYLQKRFPGPLTALIILLLTSASIPFAFFRMQNGLFASIYPAFFDGLSVTSILAEGALTAHLVPALLLGLSHGFTKGYNASDRLLIGGAVFTGVSAAAFSAPLHPGLYIPAAFTLACATAAIHVTVGRRPLKAQLLAAAAACLLPLALVFSAKTEGIRSLTAPDRFVLRAERILPAGSYAFLQSRDYDDPFHAAVWNHTVPLTQDSRIVHPALYRLGHLPMLMHENPESVLLLGFGSGKALEAVKMHKPKRIVCVEALETLPWYADSTARRESRTAPTGIAEMHIERPVGFAARSDESFDVIISPEPFATPFPTMEIFSPSHYRNIHGLLKAGGVFAQWIPLSSVTREGLRSVAASMAEVFQYRELWLANPDVENGMACIFGSAAPFRENQPSRNRFEALLKNEHTAFHLHSIAMPRWEDALAGYGMNQARLDEWTEGAEPLNAFSVSIKSDLEPGDRRRWTNAMELFERRAIDPRLTEALDDSLRAVTETVYGERATVLRAAAASGAGDDTTATRLLYSVVRDGPWNAEAKAALSEILLRRAAYLVGHGEYGQAIPLLNQVMRFVPLNTLTLRLLMIASMQTGDKQAAGLAIDGIKRLNPRHAGFRDNQATIRAQQGDVEDALLLYENAITLEPTDVEFYCNMASVQFQTGRAWEAVRILDNAVKRVPYPAKAWYLRGLIYRERGKAQLARESWENYLKWALPNDPHRAEALSALRALPE